MCPTPFSILIYQSLCLDPQGLTRHALLPLQGDFTQFALRFISWGSLLYFISNIMINSVHAFYKLAKIDYSIRICIYLVYYFFYILLILLIKSSFQNCLDFITTNATIPVLIKKFKGLLQLQCLLLCLPFETKSNELTQLQCPILIEIDLAHNVFGILCSENFAIDFGVAHGKFLDGKDSICVGVEVTEDLLQLGPLVIGGEVVVHKTDNCHPETVSGSESLQPSHRVLQILRLLINCLMQLDPAMLNSISRSRPFLAIFVHQRQYKLLPLPRQRSKFPQSNVYLPFSDCCDGLLGIVASEGHQSRESDVSNYSKTPHIAAQAVFPFEHFRRAVFRRPTDPISSFVPDESPQSPVNNLHFRALIRPLLDQDVFWLEVSMHHSKRVSVPKGFKNFLYYGCCKLL